jgi:hypothetical protein
MHMRLVASLAFLGVTTALAAGCSSAPNAGEATGGTAEAVTASCDTVPFHQSLCTVDTNVGDDDLKGPRKVTKSCTCLDLAGAPYPNENDDCEGPTPQIGGLEDCTTGMVINDARVWLCPAGTVLPQGTWPTGGFHSNCVGDPAGGWFFVSDVQRIGVCRSPDSNDDIHRPPPVCNALTGCSGPCDPT